MRNREVVTKHIFAGGTRLVSKPGRQPRDVDGDAVVDPIDGCANPPWGWTNGNGGGNGNGNAGGNGNGNGPCGNNGNGGGAGPEVFESDQYFYHPGHLGSSSYVTDVDGEIFQHLEYFPFGETWVEESSNTQRTPYLFTGQELGEQPGLYYFGARYYDPRTSVWQSPDPILASYMQGKPAGGIFVPANLAPYGYVQNKPIVAIDPNGEYCVAVVQTVTCRLPGQDNFPAFSFDRPDGWPAYTAEGENNYHIYTKAIDTDGSSEGAFGQAMRNVIVNDPTPNDSDRPASRNGTQNDATPSGGARNFFGSMVNNDVKS